MTLKERCSLMPLQQRALGGVCAAGEETESLGGMNGMMQCACVHEGDPCSNACTSLGTEHVLPRQRGHVQFHWVRRKAAVEMKGRVLAVGCKNKTRVQNCELCTKIPSASSLSSLSAWLRSVPQ